MPHKDPKTQKMQETVIVYAGCLLPDPMLSLWGYGAFHWIIELQQQEQGLKILLRSINVIVQSYFWYCGKKKEEEKTVFSFWWLGTLFHFHSFHVHWTIPESWK